METVVATGASGTKYTYNAYKHPTTWNDVPANYMFASPRVGGKWTVYYIGQCDSCQCRLAAHERWEEARKLGATHILAHTNRGGEEARKREERDLILSHDPPLNVQHKPAPVQRPTGTFGGFFVPIDPRRK